MGQPAPDEQSSEHAGEELTLVLYDGVCGLCNRSVQFLLARDRGDRFRFAPLQSDLGSDVVRRHGYDPLDLDTMYAVFGYGGPHERIERRSRAVLGAVAELGGAWGVLRVLRIVPAFILDIAYRVVAAMRYRLFGRFDSCAIPSAQSKHKFLG